MTTAHLESEPATCYRVLWPSVVTRGQRGSQSLFFQDETVRPWETADGSIDVPDLTDMARLAKTGAIEATK